MTLLQLLKEIRDMGAIDRVRRVKVGDEELELGPPVDTKSKVVKLELPESQDHGQRMSAEEAVRREEDELVADLYGASRGHIPSDYGPNQ